RCEYNARESSVERHASLPDIENLKGALDIASEVVKQNVPQPASHHHAEDQKKQQVVDVVRLQRHFLELREALEKEIADDERNHVHQPVPAELHRAEAQENRVDVWELQLKHHHD